VTKTRGAQSVDSTVSGISTSRQRNHETDRMSAPGRSDSLTLLRNNERSIDDVYWQLPTTYDQRRRTSTLNVQIESSLDQLSCQHLPSTKKRNMLARCNVTAITAVPALKSNGLFRTWDQTFHNSSV